MKKFFSILAIACTVNIFAAPTLANKTFTWATDLKYPFFPKQKMSFVNGIVKNTEATALPDIDAAYSNKIRVDNLIFTLPNELCETMSACYKADLNRDKIPDYIFINIKVWNGRFAGQSDVGIFVSNPQKKYTFNAFEARHLEAEVINGKVMLIKYAYSDDNENFIRQIYTFDKAGYIRLYQAAALMVNRK
ncbi:MAG: hypothetical protein IKB25_09360 [Lentisphaeria bacterium]|nr:hypothetical protein [Lentisphaeria bacterium]